MYLPMKTSFIEKNRLISELGKLKIYSKDNFKKIIRRDFF